MPFILWAVPSDAPPGPATVFTDRFWDHRERWEPPGVGLVPGSERPYFGPVPPAGLSPLEGTPEQWAEGFLYSEYLKGAYDAASCWPVWPGQPPTRLRQAQGVQLRGNRRLVMRQGQGVPITSHGAVEAPMREVQSVGVRAGLRLAVAQAQLLAGSFPSQVRAVIGQAQTVLRQRDATVSSCVNLDDGAYPSYTLTVPPMDDGTCDCSLLGGDYPLGYVSSCTWRSPTFPFCSIAGGARWQLTVRPGRLLRVQLAPVSGGGHGAIWEFSGWDGAQPATVSLVSGTGDCDWPPTLEVNP